MGRSFTPAGGAPTPFEGQELLAPFLCPPLQASANDYTVAARQFANASVLFLGATTAINLTGLQGATRNRELTLVNVTAHAITLKNASGASLPANRFNLDADILLNQWDAVKLLGAPPGAAGWIAVASTAAPAPPPPLVASGAFVYSTVNQSILNATATLMNLDTVTFDTDAYFNVATPNVLTAPAAGIYVVTASALWNTNASGTVILGIAHNGDLTTSFGYNAQANNAVVNIGQSVSVVLQLAMGDTVGAILEQTSGGALSVLALQRINQLSIARVH